MTATQTTGRPIDVRRAAVHTERLILIAGVLREATAAPEAGARVANAKIDLGGRDRIEVDAHPDTMFVCEVGGAFHRTIEIAPGPTAREVDEKLEQATVS